MNFQGRVPDSAITFARELASRTRWPKYVVYDVIMSIAIKYRNIVTLELPMQQTSDAHKSTLPIFKSREADEFCIKCGRISKNSDIFRHAMHRGSYILDMLVENSLPDPLTQQEVYDSVVQIVGKNARLQQGLERLAEYIAPPPTEDPTGKAVKPLPVKGR